ncbi:helix-turn-helix transcriptional regulator [Eubacteriales bacterium OttesenSCG-928-K08]|nr:helix-turn-helix transcriptional regulator [Eubacteriales bacterium OttesenSCG-928-K08]
MAIGDKLQRLLQIRKTNVNQLSLATGVNVNTIYGIIRRNNTKVKLEDLQAICDALGVTLDYFADVGHTSIDISLTKQEHMLLSSFNLASPDDQKILLRIAELAAQVTPQEQPETDDQATATARQVVEELGQARLQEDSPATEEA